MRTAWTLLLAVSALASGCRTMQEVPAHERAAREYAKALREGRIDDAHRHVEGVEAEAFRSRYADPAAREARAKEIDDAFSTDAAQELRAGSVTLQQQGDGVWRVQEAPPAADAARTLGEFLDASAAADFARAWSLLAAPLRARYSPERLAQDFAAEPGAQDRLSRARAAAQTSPVIEGDEARWPLGEGRAVRLVREGDGWRVAALE